MHTVKANARSRNAKQIIWLIAGIVSGVLVAMIPSKTGINLYAGIAAWCIDVALVAILSAHPVAARVGILMAGLFLAVPCFVIASPLSRGLLACFMALPFVAAAALACAPVTGFRARVAHLCAWSDTHPVRRRARSFDAAALQHLVVATAVLAGAIAVVKMTSAFGVWLPVRWLAGGIGLLAIAEMSTAGHNLATTSLGLTLPPFFQSPHRSTSVGEFWARRWNLPAAELLRKFCFEPLAPHGAAFAMFAAFLASAVGHALLAYLVLGTWGIAAVCGAFFLLQPLFIVAERQLTIRRWHPGAGRAWTLLALMISSPLVVEPILRIVERGWGEPNHVLLPTALTLGFVILLSSIISLASLASYSQQRTKRRH